MTNEAPFFWVRKIASHLAEMDQVPMFGNIPSFDWAKFSTTITDRFGVSSLQIRPTAQQWRSSEQLHEDLGASPIVLPLKVGSLQGSAFWIMPKQSVIKLTSWLINGQTKTRPLSSEILTTGFYRYLALQILDAASALEPLKKIAPLLSEPSPLPETDAFCIDIEIEFGEYSCWGRLCIEPKLQKSWADFFSHPQTEAILTTHGKGVELTLGIKVGSAQLTSGEIDELQPGDFLRLDQGGYDPRKHQGTAYLVLGKSPLFQVKIKQNKIQLIDYSFIYEDPMAEYTNPETPNFDKQAMQLPESTEEGVSLKDLPIHITVELSRVRITLEKLMQLTPGNLLELPIHPEQAVKLTVNGQIVGQGELVHLGEALGVRILTLG